MPGAAADHGQRRRRTGIRGQPHHALDAGQLQRRAVVDRAGAAAECRRMAHRGVDHAGQAHVEPKRALPSDLGRHVGARRGLADQAPARTRLGRGAGRRRARGEGCASSPKCSLSPEAWRITPSAMCRSAAGSFQCSDAAPSSWPRAVAAARRSGSHASAMLDEPPVALMPNSRLSLAEHPAPEAHPRGLLTGLVVFGARWAARRRTSPRCRRSCRGRARSAAPIRAQRRAPRPPASPARCARPGPSRCWGRPAARGRRA